MLKLDDLLAHLRSVREMAARLTTLKVSPAASEHSTATTGTMPLARASAPERPAERPQPRAVEDLSPALQSMAERLAQDHAKRFRLSLTGLGEVPSAYGATIKDCLIQMLRNSAVHGIESPEVRRGQSKEDTGRGARRLPQGRRGLRTHLRGRRRRYRAGLS